MTNYSLFKKKYCLAVLIPYEEDLYLGCGDTIEECELLAKHRLEDLIERYKNMSFDFFIYIFDKEKTSQTHIKNFTLNI